MYDESWDLPHPGDDHELWQESDCYWFYDAVQGIGGFHRIAQRPHCGRGHEMIFTFVRAGQRFHLSGEHALGPDARSETGQRTGHSHAESLGQQRMRYAWSHPDSQAQLDFYDSFYTPRGWTKVAGSDVVAAQMNADGHLECSGRVRGEIRIGLQQYTIDALAHRDRSWGRRDVSVASHHRMMSGTFGPELSWACFTMQLKGHGMQHGGFVVRDGQEEEIAQLDIETTTAADGLSVRSGQAHITLASGEQLSISSTTEQACLTPLLPSGYLTNDSISTAHYAERTGFCDLEQGFNPARAAEPPRQAEAATLCIDDGLSDCV